jgi:hypothetical protein
MVDRWARADVEARGIALDSPGADALQDCAREDSGSDHDGDDGDDDDGRSHGASCLVMSSAFTIPGRLRALPWAETRITPRYVPEARQP